MNPPRARLRYYGALWGIAGIVALLSFAIFRLTPYGIEAIRYDLTPVQWLVLVVWSGFMIVTEGRDGFARHLAPRIATRAQQIKVDGDIVSILLAPLYCFGYFRAPVRQMIVSYAAIIVIIIAVVIVHQFPQPWRGIVDCGVVLGLSYGIVAIIAKCISAGIHAHASSTH